MRYYSEVGLLMEKTRELEQLISQKQEEIDNLNKEFVLFKEKTFKEISEFSSVFNDLDDKNMEITELKKELRLSKGLIEKHKKEVQKLKDNEMKLKRRLDAYMNSKLGRLTKRYWAFRKKITNGGR